MKHLESKLQQSCIKYFRYQYPRYKLNLFAIPNGGYRSRTEASILAGEGVLSGIPDLFLAVPRNSPQGQFYNGMFIEMKSEKGKLSSNQKLMIEVLTNAGYLCAVCYSFDEFKMIVEKYLS